ncbi:MAG: hypothetical protein, partial [Olavius algarvensis Gamma 1 endosymbiont]
AARRGPHHHSVGSENPLAGVPIRAPPRIGPRSRTAGKTQRLSLL